MVESQAHKQIKVWSAERLMTPIFERLLARVEKNQHLVTTFEGYFPQKAVKVKTGPQELMKSCSRSHGLKVRAVACEARGTGFNPISCQMGFLTPG